MAQNESGEWGNAAAYRRAATDAFAGAASQLNAHARSKRGMSWDALGARIGVTGDTVQRWTEGKGDVPAYALAIIAKAVNSTADTLLADALGQTAPLRDELDAMRAEMRAEFSILRGEIARMRKAPRRSQGERKAS